MGKRAWLKVLYQNRKTIYGLGREGASAWRASRRGQEAGLAEAPPAG